MNDSAVHLMNPSSINFVHAILKDLRLTSSAEKSQHSAIFWQSSLTLEKPEMRPVGLPWACWQWNTSLGFCGSAMVTSLTPLVWGGGVGSGLPSFNTLRLLNRGMLSRHASADQPTLAGFRYRLIAARSDSLHLQRLDKKTITLLYFLEAFLTYRLLKLKTLGPRA